MMTRSNHSQSLKLTSLKISDNAWRNDSFIAPLLKIHIAELIILNISFEQLVEKLKV